MTTRAEADPLTVVWITASFPPEVSGVSLGNVERAHWFAGRRDVRLFLLVPEAADHPAEPDDPDDEPPAGMDTRGLELHAYASKRWLPYPVIRAPRHAALAQIDAALEKISPDLVVVTDPERCFMFGAWGMPGDAYARRRGVPYVAQYQSDYYNFALSYPIWRHLRTPVFRPVMHVVYRRFDAAICATPHAASTLREFSDIPIEQVPFVGVDLDAFSPDRADPAVLGRLAPGYDGRGRRVLYLGRLAREKRLDLIIDAFLKLSTAPGDEDLSLFIAGEGPADITGQVAKLAAASPRIHMLGYVRGADRGALYASCDAFCTASPYETLGRTVVEAMASGTPVVVPSSGGITNVLADGRNAYLFPPGDPGALLGALRRALGDEDHVTAEARAEAAQFTTENGCLQLLACYRRLAARHSGAAGRARGTP
ncbi:glycosyltransferase [Actinomadura harenae]|uniref:Glycosyltransferase n=1 Tax=Actinomadura harenae TaxID=2483351 RepID=A0A3M2LZP1_9ACTN|nr:glycosyltransferase [Actinomadura harenae]RMI40418.1 glycosyltransferase [Actinomadura harenae]